jgi:hypothetical protein
MRAGNRSVPSIHENDEHDKVGTDTKEVLCCARMFGERLEAQGFLATGKSIEDTKVDSKTCTSELQVLHRQTLDDIFHAKYLRVGSAHVPMRVLTNPVILVKVS